jgi:Spy/CpxP family protein refolding chaperone
METQKKYTWALAGFILMILLNLATLFTIWAHRPDGRNWRGNRDSDRGRSAVHQSMKRELGLTSAQEDSIATMRRRHFKETQSLKNTLENKRRAYLDLAMSNNSDLEKRDSLLTELTRQYLKVEKSMYRHISEMNSLLNAEQQQKLKKLMNDSFMHGRKEGQKHSKKNNP